MNNVTLSSCKCQRLLKDNNKPVYQTRDEVQPIMKGEGLITLCCLERFHKIKQP